MAYNHGQKIVLNDLKKAPSPSITDKNTYGDSTTYADHHKSLPLATRLGVNVDSFRRAQPIMVPNDPKDPEAGMHEEPPTLRHAMKNRHLQVRASKVQIG